MDEHLTIEFLVSFYWLKEIFTYVFSWQFTVLQVNYN